MKFFQNSKKYKIKGFVLPLTLIICVIILTISAGISIILAKELYFSRLSRLSQVAYYAADDGMMCATMVDDGYIDPDTGLGIFEYSASVSAQSVLDKINIQRTANGLPLLTLNSIKCATSDIFNISTTGYAVSDFSRTDSQGNPDNGKSTTYAMTMDLGDGTYRCAQVTVNKTAKYRQIISRGFASCSTTSVYRIERAIVSTTSDFADTSGGTTPASVSAVLTSGTSWAVPAGVTSIKVWAIGAGGGGAGSPGSDSRAGGGGGAGGVAVRVFSVTPGQIISYSLGTGGDGGDGSQNGSNGGGTSVTVSGTTIQGRGGSGGRYNNWSAGSGGITSGTVDTSSTGGDGAGAAGDVGGGGGGGIGGANGLSPSGPSNGNGGAGGQANDISGLFTILVSTGGYPTVAPGVGGDDSNSDPNNTSGMPATGFGSGGGGAGFYGGNGGAGLYGGGGGGAAGYTARRVGGAGGQGVVVISSQ